jgi:4-hydroxyproline epimerase
MAKKSFFCIDGHTCGNPVRLVAGGGPLLEGSTMMERRAHFLAEYDWIRTGLMFEPRGHDVMSGSILYPPTRPDFDIAILFIETSGCLPMCGHGTIGTVTMAIEHGLVKPKTPGVLRLDTPAGLVIAEYKQVGEYVEEVRITNVPSFLYAEGLTVECPVLGEISVDVAYGGNFYAIVEPQENFSDMADHSAGDPITWSPVLRQRLNESYSFAHPEHPEINRLSHILWTGKPTNGEADARNAVFYGDKAIDRSPCGTGTSARMAQLYAKGRLKAGDSFVHESIIGSLFRGRVEAETTVGNRPAIVPSIGGWARMTGLNTIFIDDRDPFAHGFVVTGKRPETRLSRASVGQEIAKNCLCGRTNCRVGPKNPVSTQGHCAMPVIASRWARERRGTRQQQRGPA